MANARQVLLEDRVLKLSPAKARQLEQALESEADPNVALTQPQHNDLAATQGLPRRPTHGRLCGSSRQGTGFGKEPTFVPFVGQEGCGVVCEAPQLRIKVGLRAVIASYANGTEPLMMLDRQCLGFVV